MMLTLHSLATLAITGLIFVNLSLTIETRCALLQLKPEDRKFYKNLSGGCLLAAVAAWVFGLFDVAVGIYLLFTSLAQ